MDAGRLTLRRSKGGGGGMLLAHVVCSPSTLFSGLGYMYISMSQLMYQKARTNSFHKYKAPDQLQSHTIDGIGPHTS